MYINYGDKNFFENGVLVDSEHQECEFNILWCRPYDEEDDLYQFSDLLVNINDNWIDRKAVMDFIGMRPENFNPVHYAIGCVDYYGPANFGAECYAYDWTRMTKKEICDILKYRMIASDNLDVCW